MTCTNNYINLLKQNSKHRDWGLILVRFTPSGQEMDPPILTTLSPHRTLKLKTKHDFTSIIWSLTIAKLRFSDKLLLAKSRLRPVLSRTHLSAYLVMS